MDIRVRPHSALKDEFVLCMGGASIYFDEYHIGLLHLTLYSHCRVIAAIPKSSFLEEALSQLIAFEVTEIKTEKAV